MNTFELNKVAGGVLSALLLIFGSKTVLDLTYREHKPEKAGWALPVTEAPTAPSGAPPAPFDVAEVMKALPQAKAENGKDTFKRCLQCHTSEKGGPNRIGPNLWGIVGRPRASHAGFPYSEAMKSHPGDWSFEELAKYLHDPKADIPGNKMAFAGVKDSGELADLLAYLRTLNDNPPPLPK